MVSRKMNIQQVGEKVWDSDDYSIMIALGCAWGMLIAFIFCAHYGMGKHVLRVGMENDEKFGRALYVLEAIYPASTTTTKISILLLYRRMFSTRNYDFRVALYTIFTILVGWAISEFFTTVFQCMPVRVAWRHSGGTCIDVSAALIDLAAVNTTLNAAVLILPIPLVLRLSMPWQRKVGVCRIFVIGCGDIVSSIVRKYLTSQINLNDIDFTWSTANGALLALVEPCLGIICASLPATRPLLSVVFNKAERLFSSKHSNRTSEDHTYRQRSASNAQARTYTLRLQPKSGWIELGSHDRREIVNEIRGGIALPGEAGGQRTTTMPLGAIRVQSD